MNSRFLSAAMILLMSVCLRSSDGAAPPMRIGQHDYSRVLETPHPYIGSASAGMENVWTDFYVHPGAKYIVLEFKKFDLDPGDWVEVSDLGGGQVQTFRGRGFLDKGGDFITKMVFGPGVRITLHSDKVKPSGYGYRIERVTRGYNDDELSALYGTPPRPAFCQGENDRRDAVCYKDTFPEIYKTARSVSRMIMDGVNLCTAWLVSCENHLITNNHCASDSDFDTQDEMDRTEFQFMYEDATCGGDDPTVEYSFLGGTWLENHHNLDYALVQAPASEDPSSVYGWIRWDLRVPAVDELIYIAGHPNGDPKEISLESTEPSDPKGFAEIYSVFEPPCVGGTHYELGFVADVEGGSSGSPLMARANHRAVGLVHCSGCPNLALRIVDIYHQIQAAPPTLPPCTFNSQTGRIELDRVSYACGSTLNLTVFDESSPPMGSGSVQVNLWSNTEPAPETVTLEEVPPGSGRFAGAFPLYSGEPVTGDGQLSVAHGDMAVVRYMDADDGAGGSPVPRLRMTAVDCLPPVISNVQVNTPTDGSAVITWTTDENSDSLAAYGTSKPPEYVQSDMESLVTSHSILLTGLAACTPYYFNVASADAAGNIAIDTQGGSYYAFKTYGRVYGLGPDDVESGAGSWIATGQWHRDTCRAHSGDYAWKGGSTVCPGTSGGSSQSYLTWDSDVDLGPPGHGHHLRFWQWYWVDPTQESLSVQISTSGGDKWTTLGTMIGNSSNGWIQKDFDLNMYNGHVRIRFAYSTAISSGREGWYADDIEIGGIIPCTADVRYLMHGITDACNGAGSGGGNGIVEAGEDAVIVITASNRGMQNATNARGTLSTTTPGVTLTCASAPFPDMAADGGSGTSLAPQFAVRTDETMACGTKADFLLRITTDENPEGSLSAFALEVGQAEGTRGVFAEDFSGVTPPALPPGWTIHWAGGNPLKSGIAGCPAKALTGAAALSEATDSWAYTPGIPLRAGVTYTLRFDQWVQSAAYPETFEVRCGMGADPAGQTTTILASSGYSNTTCMERAPTFLVPESGIYFIGWHYTSMAGMKLLYLDNITLTYSTVQECNACRASTAPPPVNGAGANAARFTKGSGGLLDVSYDAVACSAEKLIVLYGDLGAWSGYSGCAQDDGGNSGSTTVDSEGQSNVWYNLVWTRGAMAGHPGFAFNGVSDVPRTWAAGTLCGMTADDPSHATCP